MCDIHSPILGQAIAVIEVISGLTCERGERVSYALY